MAEASNISFVYIVVSERIEASACLILLSTKKGRPDVPVGVPLDLSTPTGMTCIWTYVEN